MKIAIIGAGFCGMLASYLLEKSGVDVTVYEKEEQIGGHCRTLVGKGEHTEMGTTFSFSREIKELLVTLQVAYTERFIYRNFIDEAYANVEQLSGHDAGKLMDELSRLRHLLKAYEASFSTLNYGYVHPDLMVPLSTFLQSNNLDTLCQVLAPLLSSFGFGSIDETQAYYAFKIFDVDTITTFIHGKKLLFINKGTSELIKQLSTNISDIRYGQAVTNVEPMGDMVKVATLYSSDVYDKVLITTKLPKSVIKDPLYSQLMASIDTNPYFTCAFAADNKNLVTTYFKSNLGLKNRIQFYYTAKQNHQTTLVAFAYGHPDKDIVETISDDIKKSGVQIKHLIAVKQWHIFPHLGQSKLREDFYEEVNQHQGQSPIWLIGSLVTHPSIANLYISVKKTVDDLLMA